VAEALIGPHADPVNAAPDAALTAPGVGAVCIRAPSLGLWAAADAGVLRHVPPPEAARGSAPALVPLERTLRSAPLRLDVTLGSVELALGPLLELQADDVIRLPTRLSDNLNVETAGQRLAGGRLGMLDGHRAVQLVAVRDAESGKR
jgi:flagellar motor switch/type III secretory pathway protein FliN